jgi:flagellar protein FliS
MANTETNPLQQLVLLYDGAIRFFNLAASDIEGGDLASKGEHAGRALDIVNYLRSILDFGRGGEAAVALDTLYAHVTATALRASCALDAGMMRRAAELMAPVREAWAVNAMQGGGPAGAAGPQLVAAGAPAGLSHIRVA